jgi:5-methylcytosine-specific restriction endonuclease McrA
MIYAPIPAQCCKKCNQWFPCTPDYFYIREAATGKLHRVCKPCYRSRRKRYYDTHQEQATAYTRSWVANNPERKKAADKAYRERSREQIRPVKHDWYIARRDRVKAKKKARYHANPEWHRAQSRQYHRTHKHVAKAAVARRRAREAAAQGQHTKEDVQRQYQAQKGKCYWCGKDVSNVYHLDHVIPLAKGGSNGPENLVIACPSCNLSKRDKLPHEWPGNGGKLL